MGRQAFRAGANFTTMTLSGDSQRDGSEAGTAAMLWGGAVVGVGLRGTTWVMTAFTVGPVLGFLDTAAESWSTRREVLFLQAVVTVAAVVAAVFCGLGMQNDPAAYRRPTRWLSYLFIADAVIYLTPVVMAAMLPVAITTETWALFGAAVVGNLGLAGLCMLIAIRARRVRTVLPVAPPTTIELPT
jgi:hypothetical protein